MDSIKFISGKTYETYPSDLIESNEDYGIYKCFCHEDKSFYMAKIIKFTQTFTKEQTLQDFKIMSKEAFKCQFNLVIASDYGCDEKNALIIMPYFSMGTLLYIHSKSQIADERMAMEYFRQICYGVMVLHQNGIICRDITAMNIFMSEYHDVNYPYYFYFAIEIPVPSKERSYMLEKLWLNFTRAPELYQGKYGKSADIFSLGCLLYFLLCNKYPFNKDFTVQSMNEGKYAGQLQVCPIFKSGLSKFTLSLLEGCLQFDPQNRIQDEVLFENLKLDTYYSKYEMLKIDPPFSSQLQINCFNWSRKYDINHLLNQHNINESIISAAPTQVANQLNLKAKCENLNAYDVILYTNIVMKKLLSKIELFHAIEKANSKFVLLGKHFKLAYDATKSFISILCAELHCKIEQAQLELDENVSGSIRDHIMLARILMCLNNKTNNQIVKQEIKSYMRTGNLPLLFQASIQYKNQKTTIKIE